MPTSVASPLIAYFVSPHGYGHAARSAAVMAALRTHRPDVRVHIFTTVPEWFFHDTLGESFRYSHTLTDIGLVQKSPLEEDAPTTVQRLDSFYPPDPSLVANLANKMRQAGCNLIVCDIAPLGIEVAIAADIPVALVENFTWDFIYEAYRAEAPGLSVHIDYLAGLLLRVDLRLQATPVCVSAPEAIEMPPVARQPGSTRETIRARLDVPPEAPLVLISLGGIPWSVPELDPFYSVPGTTFILPSGNEPTRVDRNLILMPHRTPIPHRDLVEAADLIVTKLGYSTVAEAYLSATRCFYVERSRFPESPVLAEFARRNLAGDVITNDDLVSCDWLGRVPDILSSPPATPTTADGAEVAAEHLIRLIES